jgi:hypothetical protein
LLPGDILSLARHFCRRYHATASDRRPAATNLHDEAISSVKERAKTIGLEVPWFLQQRADEVIE